MTSRTQRKTVQTLVVLASAIISVLGATARSEAQIIQNPNFEFTASGHSNGDNGGHFTDSAADVPNWDSNAALNYAVDPESIFNFTHEYYQVQVVDTSLTGVQLSEFYQHITISSAGAYALSILAAHRNDNDNTTAGNIFLELYDGHITAFGGSAITPESADPLTLTAALQTFTNTYGSLVGDYTVRVGGTFTGDNIDHIFQAGISEVVLQSTAVPEPSSFIVCCGLAAGGGLYRRRRSRQSPSSSTPPTA